MIAYRTRLVVTAGVLALTFFAHGCGGGGGGEQSSGGEEQSNSSVPTEQSIGLHVISNPPESQLVQIRNDSDHSATFSLIHNRQRIEQSLDAMLESIHDLPECFEGEPLEQKIWRFVRDRVYHAVPITGGQWVHDPLLLINSVGWGFCDDVAAAFAYLVRAAGFESRVWGLSGHVVPEVMVNNSWAMYDPDLAVYYRTAEGSTAAVADLENNALLITLPIEPIFPNIANNDVAYSLGVANIYQTESDNFVSNWYTVDIAHVGTTFELPPQASLSYPGLWVTKPLGIYGSEIAVVANLRIDLPAGWSGTIRLPLLLRGVIGSGRVRLESGEEFDIGSAELDEYLSVNVPETLQVLWSASEISLVFLLNPMRFAITGDDYIELVGYNVATLEIVAVSSNESNVVTASSVERFLKPAAPCRD
jgi:hypothetical protein